MTSCRGIDGAVRDGRKPVGIAMCSRFSCGIGN